VPTTASLHGQSIWAGISIAVRCTPKNAGVFTGATLLQAQGNSTVQASGSHSDTCTGATITVPLQLFATDHVLRSGPALVQVQVSVDQGGTATVSRTVMLKPGTKDPIINSGSTRISGTATILPRVPVIVSVPIALRCPVTTGTSFTFVSVFQRNSAGAISASSGGVSSRCTGQWIRHSVWVTISQGRWRAGAAWALVNDASRPVTIVIGGQA
jgi:hypothetical protein